MRQPDAVPLRHPPPDSRGIPRLIPGSTIIPEEKIRLHSCLAR
jgi:hypothetical protein